MISRRGRTLEKKTRFPTFVRVTNDANACDKHLLGINVPGGGGGVGKRDSFSDSNGNICRFVPRDERIITFTKK